LEFSVRFFFIKVPIIKFHVNPYSGGHADAPGGGQTYGQNDGYDEN